MSLTPDQQAYFARRLREWRRSLQTYLADPARFGAAFHERLSKEALPLLACARESVPEIGDALVRTDDLRAEALSSARGAPQPTKASLLIFAAFATELELAAADEEILGRELQALERIPRPLRPHPSPRLLARVAAAREAADQRERRLLPARPVLGELDRWIEGHLIDEAPGTGQSKARRATAAAETSTRAWLRSLGEGPRMKKKQAFNEARHRWAVSERGFDRAWASDAPESWRRPGAPKNPRS